MSSAVVVFILLLIFFSSTFSMSLEKKKFNLWYQLNSAGAESYDDIVTRLENDDEEAEKYEPEEAGLLMHVYFDEVYKKNLDYKKQRLLSPDNVLDSKRRRELKSRNKPYKDETFSMTETFQ